MMSTGINTPPGKMDILPMEIVDMIVLCDVRVLYALSSTCHYYRRRYVWDESFIERHLPTHSEVITGKKDKARKDHKRRSTPAESRSHWYEIIGTVVKNTLRHRSLVKEGHTFGPSIELYGSFSIKTGTNEGLIFPKWINLMTNGVPIHSTIYVMTNIGLMTFPKKIGLPHWSSLYLQVTPEDFLKVKELPSAHEPYELPGYHDKENGKTVMFCKIELCEALPMTPQAKSNHDSLAKAVEDAKIYLELSSKIPIISLMNVS